MTSTGGAPLSSELPFTSPRPLERPALLHQAGQRHVVVLFLLFLLSIPAITPRIYASDEVQYFAFLRSLWFDRDVSFDNEYRYFYDAGVARSDGFRETLLEMQSDTGLRISFATIGSAILWAPFYAAADAGVLLARAAGSSIPRDGYSWPYLAAVCYGSAVYGFLAVLLGVRLAIGLGLDPRHSLAAGIAIWLGTPLIFYTHVAPVFAHATSAFCVALFLTIWLRVRGTWSAGGCAALAACGALMMMVREQDVSFFIAPAIDFIWHHASRARVDVRAIARSLVAAAATFALVFTPQAIAYLLLNGHVGPPRLVSRKMNWLSPHAAEILFSPGHGLVFWTPLMLVVAAGLVVAAARLARSRDGAIGDGRVLALCLGAALVAQIYLLGSLDSWTSAGAFGQRRFVGSSALFIVGLAAALTFAAGVSRRRVVYAVVGVTVWWNLALIAEFATGLMNRQRLELRRNAYDAFVTVPAMAPKLAYRYLFDRSSFYQAPQ